MSLSASSASNDRLRELEVELIVEMIRLSRVTLLIAEPDSNKSGLLQSTVMPLLSGEGQSGKREIAILFDTWDKAPLPALHARIQQVAGPGAAAVSLAGPSSLAATLRAWQEALDVTFLIIFDRFEEYLRAPPGSAGVAEFEENFVQAVTDPALRANFLLAFDEDAERLLARLRTRIPRLGSSRVRLSRVSQLTQARSHNQEELHLATPLTREGAAGSHAEPVREMQSIVAAAAPVMQTRAEPKAAEAEHPVQAPPPSQQAETPKHAAAPKRRFARLAWTPLILIPAALLYFWEPKTPGRAERVLTPPAKESAETASPKVPPAVPGQAESGPPAVASSRREITAPKPAPAASNPPVAAAATTQPVAKPEVTPKKPPAATPAPSFAAGAAVPRSAQPEVVAKALRAPAQPASSEARSGPVLYIHVRSEAQRAWAEQLIRPLKERGIQVAGIKVARSNPDEADIRYYHVTDRNEAMKVAVALRDFGLRAQRLKQIDERETPAPARQYELWLPATGHDQRP